MTARLISLNPHDPDPRVLDEVAAILRRGGLVAFPTETVYGLGADASKAEAVARIFEAKGRPADNPLIVHVASVMMAKRYASEWPELANRLTEAFWPGPLTLILPKRPVIPDLVTAGLPAVGLRLPANEIARKLIEHADLPIAAPSANLYMSVSPTTAQHVAIGLGERIELILDGGPCAVGIESTVLDLTGEVPVVLRPGGVSLEQIQRIAPEAVLGGGTVEEGARVSPGLARRHYAPKTPVRLLDRAMLLHVARDADQAAIVTLGPAPEGLRAAILREMPGDPSRYAAALYATLHQLDEAGVREILIERPPADMDWLAVSDRLQRAATKA